MIQVNDRSTESDETFQREVLERFDADAPPADSALREKLMREMEAAIFARQARAGMGRPLSSRAYASVATDAALAVFAAHLSQQQAAILAVADEMDAKAPRVFATSSHASAAYVHAAARIRNALGTDR